MALNREQKRRLQRQGDVDADGAPVRAARTAPQQRATEERTGATQFVREVRGELRKVAWPTREETVNYSIVVMVTLVLMALLIFALDWGFANAVLKLFNR